MDSLCSPCFSRRKKPASESTDNMASPESVRESLRRLQDHPNDEQPQQHLEAAFGKDPRAVFGILKEEAATAAPAATATLPRLVSDPDWVNCVGEQRCTPLKKTRPESLADLVAIVSEAAQAKHRVRAVGSGHAFADVARTDGAVLVDPVLLDRVSLADTAQLRASARELKLVHVQAGITVRHFREELDNRGLALINMGGYDGQTISGTLSTGTHGSGVHFGPLASFARSIVFVAATGVVYQVEPADGITDPATFPGVIDGVRVVLKQDDGWFRALLVAVGCLGVIFAYTMEVTDAFSIRELRTSTTWADVRATLAPDQWAPVAPPVAAVDHFELVLNPYTCWFRNACVKVERTRLSGDVAPSGQRQDWLSALLEQVSIQSAPDLVALLNKVAFISPLVVDQAIMTLVEHQPYIDKSYNVFSLGPANDIKAMAIELHCDARQCVPTIDKLLTVFQAEARQHNFYMAGPLGIRFVKAADAFLAPEAGRLTCTIELDMLVGVATGEALARHVKEKMCGEDSTSVRLHWGLDLDFVTKDDVRAWYPDFARWHEVYQELNATGMFNNKFTDRLGISMPAS